MSDRQSGYRLLEDLTPAQAMSGPLTATDGGIVLFNGTSGTVAKDSGVTLASLQESIDEALTAAHVYADMAFRG